MATRAKLTTTGLEETLEALAQAGKDVEQAAEAMLMAGGQVFKDGMQKRVRKDTHNLEQHIDIEGPKKDGNYHFVLVGVIKPDARLARYANVNEYGSANMPAQSFVRSTVKLDRAKARRAMLEALKARQ